MRRNLISAGTRILKSRQIGSFFFGRYNLMWSRRFFVLATLACPDPEQVPTGDERKRYLDNLFDHTAARRGGG